MSLVLEALRKLERERHSPTSGLVVVAHGTGAGPWPRPVPALALAGAMALGGGLTALTLRPTTSAPPAAPLASVAVAPAMVRSLAARAESGVSPRVPMEGDSALAPEMRPIVLVPGSTRAAARSTAPPAAEPPRTTPAVADRWTLEAISEKDGRPVALVSGQLLTVGDALGSGQVVEIGPDAVTVERDGRRVVLRFE